MEIKGMSISDTWVEPGTPSDMYRVEGLRRVEALRVTSGSTHVESMWFWSCAEVARLWTSFPGCLCGQPRRLAWRLKDASCSP